MSEAVQKDLPDEVLALYKKASALFNAGKRGDAEPIFREILQICPEDPEAHNCLALALEVRGRYEEAIKHYRLAYLYGEEHPERHLIMLNLAIRLRESGNPQEALQFLQGALDLAPQEARIYSVMGNVHRDLGMIDKAYRLYLKAADLNPDLQSNWVYLGVICEIRQDFEKALMCFEKAISIDENESFAWANRIDILEKLGRMDDVEKVLAAMPAPIRETPSVRLSTARVRARHGQYREAVAMLEEWNEEENHEYRQRSHIRHYDLGRYFDKLGEFDKAFDHMRQGNEMRKLSPEVRSLHPGALISEIISHREVLSRAWIDRWTEEVPYEKGPPPVFLVGFPRSGTTLLDVILGAHEKVRILEERPTTHYLGAAVMEQAGGSLGGIMNFTPEQIHKLQDYYFKTAEPFTERQEGDLIVDKMPLATRFLDIFYRVFPNSKIIMTLRHPCDVILSCYMQNFAPNKVTLPLMDLEMAAKLYAETMNLFEKFRMLLPLDIHVIRYEDLVEDKEAEIRKMIDFLGLEWDEKFLKSHESAGKGHVVTSASYAQVREPIHSKAAGRWVHYRKHLEPVLPILEPAAKRFGYSMD